MALSEWRVVDDVLDEAAAKLSMGELLYGDGFSLQRTMTAVVVGSDRMDTVSREESADPYRLASTDAASVADCTNEQILKGMDRLLTLQASYHTGTGLGRSVYTCLWMFNLPRLKQENGVLFEFCSLLEMACAAVRELLLEARVCEDEDFNILTHGLPDVDAMRPVDDVITKAESALTNGRNDASVNGLLSRVKFQRYWLLGIRSMMNKSKQSLSQASKHFTNAQMELKNVRATIQLGTEIEKGFQDRLATAGQHMRFSKILSQGETWQHFEKLLEEMKRSTSIVHVSSFKEMVGFLTRFSSKNQCAISRSALYLQLDDRRQSTDQELPKWVPTKRLMAEAFGIAPSKVEETGTEAVYFLEQAVIGIQNLVSCLCLNPFRQRRRLKRSLEDWHHLYDHAQAADTSEGFSRFMIGHHMHWPLPHSHVKLPSHYNPGPFTIWVERQTCRVMLRHLLTGFDQDLYQTNEFLSIYWYCDYLYARAIICSRELFSLWPSSEASGNKKQIKAHQQSEIIRSQRHAAEEALMELERNLCQGLTRLLVGLRAKSIVDVPELPFNEEQHRFEQRFLSLWIVGHPEPLDYRTFRTSLTATSAEPSQLMVMAGRFFAAAKEYAVAISKHPSSVIPEETQTRVANLEKISKINSVAAGVLDKLMTGGAAINVRFNFEMDKQYPSIAISR